MFNGCSPLGRMINSMGIDDPLAPTASLCINGSLAVADPTYNRPTTQSAGTGFGPAGTCTLSGMGTAVRHDVYSFNITGCAAFPTEVTATLCGPAGCQHVGNTDTVLTLYRNVTAGDPFTANGGLPAVFNPAATCTNARGLQDDLGTTVGTTNNTGGSTCNQVVTTQCVAPCTSPSNAGLLSGFRRQLGNGRFTLVVAGFSNATTGNYNLFVDAPAAGCLLALAPTAASAVLAGRVSTSAGRGITNVIVSVTGGSLAGPLYVRTSAFGYYNFPELQAGESYVVTVASKRFTFANPSMVVDLQDSVADADFVSEQ